MEKDNIRVRKLLLSLVLIGGSMPAAPANATTVYSYTSPNYFLTSDSPQVPGQYTTSMAVTGTIELAAPLAPNIPALTDITGSVLSFSFNDGQFTLTDADADTFGILVGTDSLGTIDSWQFSMTRESFPRRWEISSIPGVGDFARNTLCAPVGCSHPGSDHDTAQTLPPPYPGGAVGSWSLVPEPGTGLLVMAGLLGLAARRKLPRDLPLGLD